jgi:PAS domain S-box-containing protein
MDVTELAEMTQELQRRKAYLAEAQKLSHTGSFGWRPDTGEIVWSDETYRIFKYNAAEKPTLNMVLPRVHPQDRALAQQVIEDASRSGTDFEHEYRLAMPSETIKHLHVRAHALYDPSGNIEFVGAVTDITERKRAEDSLRATMADRARLDAVRAEVGMALARRDSLKGILHTCAEAIVHHLDAAFARIWTLSSDGLQLELQASAGMYTRLDGRYSRIPFGRFKIGLIAQERKAHLTNDVPHDPWIGQDWAITEGINSFAGYPLVVEDRIVGVMGMFSREVLGKSTLDTLAVIADGIAQGIERKKAEEKLRQSEKQLRDVIETMPAMAFTLLPNGSTEFVIHRFTEYTGLKAEEAGLHRRNTVHTEDIAEHMNKWQASLASGEPFENEVRHLGADGQYRWFLVRGVPLRNEHGAILKWFGTLTDIEDRSRPKRDSVMRTSLCVRRSTKDPCSRRLSVAPRRCRAYLRGSPKLPRRRPLSSSPAKRVPARSLSLEPSTSVRRAPRTLL